MDQPTEQHFSKNIVLHQLQQIDKEEKIIMFKFNLIQEWSYIGMPVQLHSLFLQIEFVSLRIFIFKFIQQFIELIIKTIRNIFLFNNFESL